MITREGLARSAVGELARGERHGPLIPSFGTDRERWVACRCGEAYRGPGLTWRHGRPLGVGEHVYWAAERIVEGRMVTYTDIPGVVR